MPRIADLDLTLTDGALLLLLVPLCLYLTHQLYRSLQAGPTVHLWLMGLRTAAFLLLLALLVEPILALRLTFHRSPLVAVLVDNSESMRTEDPVGSRSRRALILASEAEEWASSSDARLAWYRFSNRLDPLEGAGVDPLSGMSWDGRATDIAGALDALKQTSQGAGLVATVLISDGGHNHGGRPERAAGNLGSPVIAVGVGDPSPPVDLAVTSASVDPLGYVGQELVLQAGVRAGGLSGRVLPITVTQGSLSVAVQAIHLDDGEQQVSFTLKPDRAGRHVYKIGVDPQEGEASEANNSVLVSTRILDNHRRILLVGGRPSADLAYLRRLLASDPNFDVVFRVATGKEGLAREVRAELAQVQDRDLVILVDVPADVLAGPALSGLGPWVRDGGALLIVGGPSAWNAGYADPQVQALMPLRPVTGRSGYAAEPFLVIPEASAPRHPIMRLSEDPIADREAWAELPPLLGCNHTLGVADGAAALLTHETARLDGTPMPIAAVMTTGRGKTMGVAFRTFWRHGMMMWGIGKTDRVSRAFWSNAVRWLVTPEDSDRVRVTTDKLDYRSGETVSVRARVLDALQQPVTGANVTLVSAGSVGAYEVRLRDDGRGRYVGRLSAGDQGDHAFRVCAVSGNDTVGSASTSFTVGRYSLEFESVRMNADLLRTVADASGGVFALPDSLASALHALPLNPQVITRDHRWRLWGLGWPLILLVCLLTGEWTLRRVRGMV